MKNLSKMVASFAVVGAFVVGSLGVVATETGCSATTGSTCSSSEEQSCTNTYTACINEAANSTDTNKCNQCVDDYCKCYDSCGNSCDRDKLAGSCTGQK